MPEETVFVDIVTCKEGSTGNRPWRRWVLNAEFSTFDATLAARAKECIGDWAVLQWKPKGEFRQLTDIRRA